MKVLVTGVSGQIGRYVANVLDDVDVVGIDVRNPMGSINYMFINGDVADRQVVERITKDVDVVVHLAASISVEESWEHPDKYVVNNVLGTVNLLHYSALNNVSKFIYVSSASVYGHPEYLPVDEDHPLRPISPYGASKVAGEYFARVYSDRMDVYIVRPFNVYSEYLDLKDPYSGVIARFIDRLLNGQPPVIFGDGMQTRDFIHALDVARFIRMLIMGSYDYKIYNIGSGIPTRIKDLAYRLIEVSGRDFEPIYTEERPGDIRYSYADISRAKSIGFEPRRSLMEDLEEIYHRYAGGKD